MVQRSDRQLYVHAAVKRVDEKIRVSQITTDGRNKYAEMKIDAAISGQLIRNFNWGPAQPSGGPQHCMYVVGGILGYQWADFHCDFEMNFLCEYQASK